MSSRFLSLPWKVSRPSIPRRVFWQVCAGMPLTALVFWSGTSGLAGLAWIGLLTPAALVVLAYMRAFVVRTDEAALLARDTAHAAVYSTLILFTVAAADAVIKDALSTRPPY